MSKHKDKRSAKNNAKNKAGQAERKRANTLQNKKNRLTRHLRKNENDKTAVRALEKIKNSKKT